MIVKDDLSYGVNTYFWKRYGGRAKRIATSDVAGFTLYTIAADSFIAK